MRSFWKGLVGLPIRIKIALIGVTGVVGMVVIMLSAQYGDGLRARMITGVQGAALIEIQLMRVSALVSQLHGHEMEWLLRQQDGSGEAHAAIAKDAAGTLAYILDYVGMVEDMPASFGQTIGKIQNHLQDYVGVFARLHEARRKMTGGDAGGDSSHAVLMGLQQQSHSRFEPLLESVATALKDFRAIQDTTLAARTTSINSLVDLMRYISLLTIILVGVLSILIGLRLGVAIQSIDKAIRKLAAGSFNIELPHLDRADDIGRMAQGLDAFRIKLQEKTRHEAERDIALKMEVDFERRAAARELADQFEATVSGVIDEVSRLSSDLQTAAGSLADTARTSERASGHVSQASEEVATTAMSVAQASDEMSSSIAAISQRLEESNRIAQDAVAQIAQTNKRMENLASASSKIDDIVNLISGIAKQTNLLALNATIEAARAGEAGRGFAVVAQEVKALANQTAQATASITNQIAAMLNASHDSVSAITEIGKTVMLMSQFSTEIASAIAQQSAATQEIARNTQLSAQNTGEITQRIHEISTGASETGSAANQLLLSARQLGDESAHLRDAVNEFLTGVRAA